MNEDQVNEKLKQLSNSQKMVFAAGMWPNSGIKSQRTMVNRARKDGIKSFKHGQWIFCLTYFTLNP